MFIRRFLLTVVLSLVALLGLNACSDNRAQAWQMIENGALLVDVRTPSEYNAGHLPNARLIPIGQLSARLEEFGKDKNRPVVVYCASGGRSGKAKSILEANGFTQVVNAGGYEAMMAVKP